MHGPIQLTYFLPYIHGQLDIHSMQNFHVPGFQTYRIWCRVTAKTAQYSLVHFLQKLFSVISSVNEKKIDSLYYWQLSVDS
uniref:Uncharacterized protein n=1 Tax=Arundo donax TaxID=35708 RepID=A0A0A9E063_ARUDO